MINQLCFDPMRSFSMKFNIKIFGATSVTYLEFQISETGISPANYKVMAILQFVAPTTMKLEPLLAFVTILEEWSQTLAKLLNPSTL